MKKDELVREIGQLSSGTLAALTGHRDIEVLREIERDFVEFVRSVDEPVPWRDWCEAWKAFSAVKNKVSSAA